MNAEVKEKWLKALRSGEYKQTRACLKNNEGFCCLGVLCDLYSKEFNVPWEVEYEEVPHSLLVPYFYILKSDSTLPDAVVQWAGVGDENPRVFPEKYAEKEQNAFYLSKLNDVEQLDFNEIADIIEDEL